MKAKKLLKKKKGSLDGYIVPLISLIFFSVILILALNVTNASTKKDKVDILARKYLLIMESNGKLDIADGNALKEELRKIGVKDISINDSCFKKVKYGDVVTIKFSCSIPYKKMQFTWGQAIDKNTEYVEKEYEISTTSKGD